MGRVNANATFRTEDYAKEQRAWLPRFFQPLNLLFTQIVGVLHGNVEFGSNIPSQENLLEFNFDGATFPAFAWHLNRPPNYHDLGLCLEDGAQVSLVITWLFDASTGLVNVTSIFRMTANGSQALQTGLLYKIKIQTMA